MKVNDKVTVNGVEFNLTDLSVVLGGAFIWAFSKDGPAYWDKKYYTIFDEYTEPEVGIDEVASYLASCRKAAGAEEDPDFNPLTWFADNVMPKMIEGDDEMIEKFRKEVAGYAD